ncbi:MAG: KamA family radical SAM protein [Bacteroidales bacterium]|jgi:lysine 2,3-aminomutase|nr:KamA family radical SAM protein [Bacteroidales bacterium]MDD3872334.1 KamA family radical SAM protein [Bacteroidales bacterium]NLO68779.1 KamA family radical SAM protein [Bacteroidales bacterium]
MKNEEVVAEHRETDEATSLEPPSYHPLFPVSNRSADFLKRHFPGSTLKDWISWPWQVKNSFTSVDQLSTFLGLSESEAATAGSDVQLPLRITPYFASLLEGNDPFHALRRTVVPVIQELTMSPGESEDPLSEMDHSPVPQLVHRYPDRVLFLVTNFCSTYCRYCTRTHIVSQQEKAHSTRKQWDVAIEYIRNHPEIRDVLLSGGDPLTLPDSRLEYLLSQLRAIPHVEILRIGTKVPVVLPMRITRSLTSMLRKYHPLMISIHFTHPDEVTPETAEACNRLADAGIPLGSQTVLLHGINDTPDIYKSLAHKLLKVRVKPYYLYQCDPIPGSSHFRTPVESGLEIIRNLRGFTSGYAVPHYVIDAPGGGGKIPLLPNYVEGYDGKDLLLKNYEGRSFRYPDYL